MSPHFNFQGPQLEINEPIQAVDFVGRGDSPLLLQSKMTRVLTFGTREESFGHEMVRFQFVKEDGEWPQDTNEKLFFAYANPGLIFTEMGRYVFFISPIGGAGLYNPSEREFAIMYPLIGVDMVNERFAFVNENMTSPFTVDSVLENIKQNDFAWHSGVHRDKIHRQFRELNPRVDLTDFQTAPDEPSFLKRVFKKLFSRD